MSGCNRGILGLARCAMIAFIAMCVPALTGALGAAWDEESLPAVFAHYYPWWAGDKPEYPLQPQIGWYAHARGGREADPADLLRRHIAMARSAGLAGFCCEWPGRDSPETKLLANGLVAANNALPPEQRIGYLLCFDTTIWAMAYRKLIQHWYEPILLDDNTAAAFAAELAFVRNEWPKLDPHFRSNYLHVAGRPAVFVYNAHGLAGEWEKALTLARAACEPSGGIFLIGDFEVSPHPMFDQKRSAEYGPKAACFDAVSNYTLFSGHVTYSLDRYIATGQLKSALDNGQQLARQSRARQYYPGIIPQYFKSRGLHAGATNESAHPQALTDRAFVRDVQTGYFPIYQPAESEPLDSIADNSRRTLQILLDETFSRRPRIVFVTSWNEPFEGTMIEPTVTPNPSGYIMGDDFLEMLKRRLQVNSPRGN